MAIDYQVVFFLISDNYHYCDLRIHPYQHLPHDHSVQPSRSLYFFLLKTSDQSTASGRSDMMNADWKRGSPASYTLKYTHNSCSDRDIFTLVCLKMGKLLIIHGKF